jgi:hypothetical protein
MAAPALVFPNRKVRWPISAVALTMTLVVGCMFAGLAETSAFA